MKFLKKDLDHNRIIVKIENLDDLWYLSNVISAGDFIKTKTYRRIRANEESTNSEREIVFIKILAEKIDFNGKILHVLGTIAESSNESIPLNSHHSFNISIGDVIDIEKEFKKTHLEILNNASKSNSTRKILVVVVDDGEANIGILSGTSVEYYVITKNIGGKYYLKQRDERKKEFYSEVLNAIKNFTDITRIIIAGAGFEKENFFSYIKEKEKTLSEKIIIENIGSHGVNGISEVIKRSKNLFAEINTAEDARIMEVLLKEISKKGLYVYGINDTKNALNYGAIEILVITNKFFLENRKECEEIIKQVYESHGKLHIINSENESGAQLDSLGGIGAILRFKI